MQPDKSKKPINKRRATSKNKIDKQQTMVQRKASEFDELDLIRDMLSKGAKGQQNQESRVVSARKR